MIPFFEVLLHTYMETLRVEGDGKEREVNHHGKTLTVGSYNAVAPSGEKKYNYIIGRSSPMPEDVDTAPSRSRSLLSGTNNRLVSRDEQQLVEARKEFYKNVGDEKELLKKGEWIGKTGIPIFVAIFCILYWGYGLSYYL